MKHALAYLTVLGLNDDIPLSFNKTVTVDTFSSLKVQYLKIVYTYCDSGSTCIYIPNLSIFMLKPPEIDDTDKRLYRKYQTNSFSS